MGSSGNQQPWSSALQWRRSHDCHFCRARDFMPRSFAETVNYLRPDSTWPGAMDTDGESVARSPNL
ncbi:MAG: hypothetical protein NVSMB48_09130 [Marmoricola sp.]